MNPIYHLKQNLFIIFFLSSLYTVKMLVYEDLQKAFYLLRKMSSKKSKDFIILRFKNVQS